jgi:hypothetical protein
MFTYHSPAAAPLSLNVARMFPEFSLNIHEIFPECPLNIPWYNSLVPVLNTTPIDYDYDIGTVRTMW